MFRGHGGRRRKGRGVTQFGVSKGVFLSRGSGFRAADARATAKRRKKGKGREEKVLGEFGGRPGPNSFECLNQFQKRIERGGEEREAIALSGEPSFDQLLHGRTREKGGGKGEGSTSFFFFFGGGRARKAFMFESLDRTN